MQGDYALCARSGAREGMDFRLSDGPPLDPRELVHVQAAKMAGVDAPAQRFPSPAAPRRAGPKVPTRARLGSAPHTLRAWGNWG